MVSGVDPKRTFRSLCEPEHLPPEFLWRIRHLRVRGMLAKVNLALSGLPAVAGHDAADAGLPLRIAPASTISSGAFDHAKYR